MWEREKVGKKVDSPKRCLHRSFPNMTSPGSGWHGEIAETQGVVVLNNLAQKRTPVNFNIRLQKQKAACYVVSVKSQLLRRPILWGWSLKWKCELDPGPAPFKSILGSIHCDIPLFHLLLLACLFQKDSHNKVSLDFSKGQTNNLVLD